MHFSQSFMAINNPQGAAGCAGGCRSAADFPNPSLDSFFLKLFLPHHEIAPALPWALPEPWVSPKPYQGHGIRLLRELLQAQALLTRNLEGEQDGRYDPPSSHRLLPLSLLQLGLQNEILRFSTGSPAGQ